MLSEEARNVCGRWFGGINDTLKSHEPHATLRKHQAAVEELVEAGIITRESYNDHGSLLFRATPAAVEIAGEVRKAAYARMFGTAKDGEGPNAG